MRSIRHLTISWSLGALFLCLAPLLAFGQSPREIIPTSAPHGARVIVVGSGLDAQHIVVTFSGTGGARATAPIDSRTSALMESRVPPEAVSGNVRVTRGTETLAEFPFTVTPAPEYATVTTIAAASKNHDLFKEPRAFASTPSGAAYVADTGHHQIRILLASGEVSVLAGTGKPGLQNGPAGNSQFKGPEAVVFDPIRNVLYVADTGNHVIRSIAADGTVRTFAGSGNLGDRDGVGSDASFKLPAGVALDPQGNLFVADTGNGKVRVIRPDGVVSTYGGGGAFNSPRGIAVRDGIVYVADAGSNVIRKIENGIVITIAGTGHPGHVDGPVGTSEFHEPTGIAIDDHGALLVADSRNHAIRRIVLTPAEMTVTTIGGTGYPGLVDGDPATAQFHQPAGLDFAGALFTADAKNDAIRAMFTPVTISAVYPRFGPLSGRPSIRIFGSGFVRGRTSVKFGSAAATDVQYVSSTEIRATAPANAAGFVDVEVATTGGSSTLAAAFLYLEPPSIASVEPLEGKSGGGQTVVITGSGFVAEDDVAVLFGDVPAASVTVLSWTSIEVETPAQEPGTVDVHVTTSGGSTTRPAAFTYFDPPIISSFAPTAGVSGTVVTISGSNFDPDAAGNVVSIGGIAAPVLSAMPTRLLVTVPAGAATGRWNVATAGGTAVSATDFVVIVYDRIAVQPALVSVLVGQTTTLSAVGVFADGSTEALTGATWTTANEPVATVDANGTVRGIAPGSALITATAGPLSAFATVTVENPLPPDPATTAPPTDPTRPTIFTESITFLYTGANATQRDVSHGAIASRRASVVRGRVVMATGAPLPGVRTSALHAPEAGYTLSRNDGVFDLVLNGGGAVTVSFTKDGYIPVHRTVMTPWNDIVVIHDVQMIPYDAQATAIRLPMLTEVTPARGSLTSDEWGERRATLLFQPGTMAAMKFSNGTTQPLEELHVRATEQSVGPVGAMPAVLPPESAYTYCVELSADEAVAAGAATIEFSKPVFVYVENFLGFPVGTQVPAGYYDRDLAQWIASDDGRVVKVLDVTGGIASLDTNGDDLADEGSSLGVTEAERQTLASLYGVGQTLWRVGVTHFTPWDFNWGWGPPTDALPPDVTAPFAKTSLESESCHSGSIIQCESLSLGQSIPIAGTPFTLEYRSRNMPGYRAMNEIVVSLGEGELPSPLRRIEVDMTIAGKKQSRTFTATANQKVTFEWDGSDVYGRPTYTESTAKLSIHYIYPTVFLTPPNVPRSFATAGGQGMGIPTRQEVPLSQEFIVPLRGPRPDQGLGGWTLSAVHAYDPTARMLRLGTGVDISLDVRGSQLRSSNTAAGAGVFGIAVGPDGSIYVNSGGRPATLRRFRPDGLVQIVAGGGTMIPADGVAAVGAWISISDVHILGDGEIVFNDNFEDTIYRIDRNGLLRELYTGQNVGSLAASAAGIYFIDGGTLKRVDLRGNASVVAQSEDEFRISAVRVSSGGTLYTMVLKRPLDIFDTLNQDDSIYRGIGPDAPRIAKFGPGCGPTHWTIDRGGRVVTSSTTTSCSPTLGLRFIDSDGVAQRLPVSPPPVQPSSIAFLPNNELVYIDLHNQSICPFVNGRFSCVIVAGHPVAGTDSTGGLNATPPNGTMGFRFDPNGRHVETKDLPFGAIAAKIEYDSGGLASTIEDADGSTTLIERSSNGRPIAIVAPNGERTALELDANGWLSEIRGPGGVVHGFNYTADGLMRTHTDPRGKTSHYEYDSSGRLESAQDPGQGSKSLTATEGAESETITLTTAEGRTWRYITKRPDITSLDRTITDPRGLQTRITTTPLSAVALAPDGMRSTATMVADPIWKTLRPLPASTRLDFPSGRVYNATRSRTVSGASAANPYAFSSLVDRSVVNGLTTTTSFTASSRSIRTVSPLGRAVEQLLDEKGRTRELLLPGLAPLNVQYDDRGRTRSMTQGQRAYQFTWNQDDRLESMSDPEGRTTSFTYDDAGRIESQTLPDMRVISFAYDAAGNLVSLTPPGRPAHTFSYDDVGLPDQYQPPQSGPTHSVYNRDRELTRISDAGSFIDFTYDRGRLQGITDGQRSLTVTYGGGGQLQAIADSDGPAVSFQYDGFLPTQMSWSGEVSGQVSWAYDANLRLSSESVSGVGVSYGYDNDSLVTSAGAQTIARDAATGWVNGTSLGAMTDAYTYNSFGEIARYGASLNGTEVFSIQYARDQSGRITGKTENRFGFPAAFTYEYDATGRLERVRNAGSEILAQYAYDDNGNRLSVTRPGGVTSATYDAADRILTYGAATYTHGPSGELTAKTDAGGTTTYDYDAFGNLRRVKRPGAPVIEYVIDAANRRVGKKIDGTLVRRWLYGDGLRIIAELDGAGTLLSRFVYSTRANVPDHMIRGGITYRYLTDHLGSVRYVLDATTGAVMQSVDYDEFGQVVFDSNPGYQPFGFAGGLHDPETGLVRFGARDYDPQTGRWTTKEPLGFDGGDTNLYAYVLNDPINLIDPLGTDWLDTVEAISNFSAGFGDSLTFGATDWLRENVFGGNEAVDRCSGAYGWGQRAEIGFELAAMGGSGALRGLAAGASRKQVYAAAKRATSRVPGSGGTVHHVNPLFGHPGGRNVAPTLFPTGGLPASIHSGSWNLKRLSWPDHLAAHRRLRRAEGTARTAVNPAMTGARGAWNLDDGCGCR